MSGQTEHMLPGGGRKRLVAGVHLGPYEVVSLLGVGGMGEVYKARDTRLNRTVAIKVLQWSAPEDHPERRGRLLREARTASALNHPNIVTIHDVISEDGHDSIVMEYVEGRTLQAAIGRKGLPVKQVCAYGIQIADALAAAHAAGIIHRDLKPGNVMLTETGAVKVLDFGLAKMQPVGPEGETASLTAEGIIAGTVAYMSPEQAEGKRVDARSDLFSFGSLLYEMLLGQPAFRRESTVATLTAILHQEPAPLSALVKNLSPELDRIVQRCLQKDPARRLNSMHDVRILLEEIRDAPAPVVHPNNPSSIIHLRPLSLALIIVAASVGAALLWMGPARPDFSSYSLTPFATEAGEENSPAWSPDGRSLTYEFEVDGTKQIYTRSLDASSGTRVTNAVADCTLPFWAPDGSRIFYVSQGQLWSVSPAGGAPRRLLKDVMGASISPDGKTMAFSRGTAGDAGIWIASPPEADPRRYRAPPFPDRFAMAHPPQFSPDGTKIAVAISPHTAASDPELWLLPVPLGAPVRAAVQMPVERSRQYRLSWMPDNRHVVVSGLGQLYMLDTHGGQPRALTVDSEEEYQPAVSRDGRRIAFAAGSLDFDIVEIAIGTPSPKPVLATARSEWSPSWSPQGTQYAYVTNTTRNNEIWVRSAQDGRARPLVRRDATLPWYSLGRVHFSPDGRRIAYDLYGSRHLVAISSVEGGPPVIPDTQSLDQHGASWSPDGNWIAYRRVSGTKWELVKRPLGGGESTSLDETQDAGGETEWSPSGEWICHPMAGSLRLVSPDGARRVIINSPNTKAFGFSHDSAVLYAVRQDSARRWELVAFALPGGEQKRAMPLDFPIASSIAGFSMHPDGKRFITSLAKPRFDIWLLEGFAQPHRWFTLRNP